jgi:hypothetical protein
LHADGDPERTAEAHRYAHPPRVFAGGGAESGPLSDGSRLVACDDPALVVSAIEPQADGSTLVRLYNASDRARRASIRHGFPGAGGFDRVDLRGRVRSGAAAPVAARALIDFDPWEIVTLRPR